MKKLGLGSLLFPARRVNQHLIETELIQTSWKKKLQLAALLCVCPEETAELSPRQPWDTHFDESENSLGQDRRPWAGGEGKRRKKEGQYTCTHGSGLPKTLSVPGRRTSLPCVVLPLARALTCMRVPPQHGSACGQPEQKHPIKNQDIKIMQNY